MRHNSAGETHHPHSSDQREELQEPKNLKSLLTRLINIKIKQ